MIKKTAFLFVLLLITATFTQGFASNQLINTDTLTTKSALHIPIDGIQISKNCEEEYEGPMSFSVVGDNTYILDTLSSKIKVYKNSILDNEIKLPDNHYYIDFYIDKENVYLLDSKYNIIVFDSLSGQQIQAFIIPKISELTISTTVAGNIITGNIKPQYITVNNGDIYIRFQNNREYLFDGISLYAQESNNTHFNNGKAYYKTDSSDIQLQTSGYPINVYCLASDSSGNEFIKLDSMYQDKYGKKYIEECVQQVNKNNKPLYAILNENGIFIPNRNVVISETGQIYQMVITENGLDIFEIAKTNTYKQKYNMQKWDGEWTLNKSGTETLNTINPLAVTTTWSTVTKTQVDGIVNQYWGMSWTYNNTTNGNINRVPSNLRQYVEKPSFLVGYTDGQNHVIYNGMPYCWGGFDLPSAYITKVNGTTYYAGNVSSGNPNGWTTNTAGVDCSGFVCRAFLLPTHYSTNPNSGTYYMAQSGGPFVSKTGTPSHYDVWLKNGHTMLNDQPLIESGQLIGYEVFEATTLDNVDCWSLNYHNLTYISNFSLYKYASYDPNH